MFKNRTNIITKWFPNFWIKQCCSYSSAFIDLHINFSCGWRCWSSHGIAISLFVKCIMVKPFYLRHGNLRKLWLSYTYHLQFSLHCRHNKILPKDLQLKSKIKTERSKIILQCAGKLLLQEQIHINHVIRNRLKNSIKQLKR